MPTPLSRPGFCFLNLAEATAAGDGGADPVQDVELEPPDPAWSGVGQPGGQPDWRLLCASLAGDREPCAEGYAETHTPPQEVIIAILVPSCL